MIVSRVDAARGNAVRMDERARKGWVDEPARAEDVVDEYWSWNRSSGSAGSAEGFDGGGKKES